MGKKMVRMVLVSIVILIGLGMIAPEGRADEVVLVNGDKLTGAVVKVEGGKLTLKTEYAGAIKSRRIKSKKSLPITPRKSIWWAGRF
jgi:hypothetical protein